MGSSLSCYPYARADDGSAIQRARAHMRYGQYTVGSHDSMQAAAAAMPTAVQIIPETRAKGKTKGVTPGGVTPICRSRTTLLPAEGPPQPFRPRLPVRTDQRWAEHSGPAGTTLRERPRVSATYYVPDSPPSETRSKPYEQGNSNIQVLSPSNPGGTSLGLNHTRFSDCLSSATLNVYRAQGNPI